MVEPQLKTREVERIDAVSKFLEQAAVSLRKHKSLLRYNHLDKEKNAAELKLFELFFEKFEDAIGP